jgi:hypothetical protein
MIVFDDFLPNCKLRLDLTKFFVKTIPITWTNRNNNPSNPIEHLCQIVWNDVVNIKQDIDGWEYWAHHLTSDTVKNLDFHFDTDLDCKVSSVKEEEMIRNNECRTADQGFIYYSHQSLPKGGYLEIKRNNNEIERIEPVPNRLIVMDVSKQHRVTDVKGGVRKSIVSNAWSLKPYHYKNKGK